MRESFAPALPIRTDRLRLRLLTLDDREALLKYRSDPSVCRYLPFEPQGPREIEGYLRTRCASTALEDSADSSISLGVVDGDSGVLVGDVILFVRSPADQLLELGWVLSPEHRGRGYATEAAAALLALAFDGMRAHRVVARMDPANEASARVATRIGMRREAVHLESELVKGAWQDVLLFAILEREYRAGRAAVTESFHR